MGPQNANTHPYLETPALEYLLREAVVCPICLRRHAAGTLGEGNQ